MAKKVASSSSRLEVRTSCDHLGSLAADLTRIPTPGTPCNSCQHASDNWLCLSCKDVLCGRHVNKHMLQHYEQTSHSVVLSLSDLSVWCYSCGAYLCAQVIPQLRSVHDIALRSLLLNADKAGWFGPETGDRFTAKERKQVEAEQRDLEVERRDREAERRNREAERRDREAERRDREAERRDREAERRDREAERRDREAERRDREAERRDREAERRDREAERLDREAERRDQETERRVREVVRLVQEMEF